MLKIIQQKRNELLQREEISALKDDFRVPTMNETKTELANLLKKNEELIAIKRIKGGFGSRQFVIEAYAYDNREVMKKIEPKIKEKKDKSKETATEKREQTKTQEAKPEEKKTEENKKE